MSRISGLLHFEYGWMVEKQKCSRREEEESGIGISVTKLLTRELSRGSKERIALSAKHSAHECWSREPCGRVVQCSAILILEYKEVRVYRIQQLTSATL
jgi:hypothetical protein